MWQLAGVVGVNPDQMTLRQLVVMAEARRCDEWDRAAQVLATLVNCHRTKGRPARAEEFHPFAQAVKRRRKAGLKVKPSFIAKAFKFKKEE